jgi:predicted nucleotidyltransferase
MLNPIDPVTEHTAGVFLKQISAQYDIVGAMLLGSRARGDFHQDSDADLAVLLRGQKQEPLLVVSQMASAAFDVMLDTGGCWCRRCPSGSKTGNIQSSPAIQIC